MRMTSKNAGLYAGESPSALPEGAFAIVGGQSDDQDGQLSVEGLESLGDAAAAEIMAAIQEALSSHPGITNLTPQPGHDGLSWHIAGDDVGQGDNEAANRAVLDQAAEVLRRELDHRVTGPRVYVAYPGHPLVVMRCVAIVGNTATFENPGTTLRFNGSPTLPPGLGEGKDVSLKYCGGLLTIIYGGPGATHRDTEWEKLFRRMEPVLSRMLWRYGSGGKHSTVVVVLA